MEINTKYINDKSLSNLLSERKLDTNSYNLKELSDSLSSFPDLNSEDSEYIVNELNKMTLLNDKLRFSFNEEHHTQIIKVFDRENDILLREFPSKEFFKNLSYFKEHILKGLLFNEKS